MYLFIYTHTHTQFAKLKILLCRVYALETSKISQGSHRLAHNAKVKWEALKQN